MKKGSTLLVLALLPLVPCSAHAENEAGGGDPFWRALTGGKPNLSMRYRYEIVDDDFAPGGVPLDDANASTLRTVLGYRTASFRDFEAYLQIENVTELGADDYNDGSNGKTRFATVADPTGTEIIDGYLGFAGLPGTRFRVGRQVITYRPDPFHRFIGPVVWRQKWQNYDAFTAENRSLPDTRISYAYVWNVNRIFGEDAPSPLDDFDSDSHFVNMQYEGFALGKLEAYAYLLDFDNAAGFSTQTYGARFDGKYAVTPNLTALYVGEYAYQTDYADNPADIDAGYIVGELGTRFKTGWIVDSVTVKLSYELLQGDGGADRFVTILATAHPFQGWADRFVVTPGDGVEDIYVTLIATAFGAQLMAVYHDFSSDRGGYDYGDEWDLQLTRTFREHYTLGLKYSDYDGDRNATNLARNPVQAADVSKFWAFAELKF